MADCHLGSWSNHPDMKEYPLLAFENAVDICIKEQVDFILIAGDLFDTSMPGIDVLKRAVVKLKECREKGIEIYTIPGSHDFSPTGKTFLSVLENAGLLRNVARWEGEETIRLIPTKDRKTGAAIAGLIGRKGGLERSYFERLAETEKQGFSIFMFHSAIEDYKPGYMKMEAVPLSLLPKNFDYYASGHVHMTYESDESIGKVVFPGSLFPTDFEELEKYDSGFFVVSVNNGNITTERKSVKLFETIQLKFNAEGKDARQVHKEIMSAVSSGNISNKVVLLRVEGCMNGRISDIDFASVTENAYRNGARSLKKNTGKLTTREFEEVEVNNIVMEDLEKELVRKHSSKSELAGHDDSQKEALTFSLINALKEEKDEGETNYSYEQKIRENAKKIMGL